MHKNSKPRADLSLTPMASSKKLEGEEEAAEAEVMAAVGLVEEEEAEVVPALVTGNDASLEAKVTMEVSAEMVKDEEEASEVDGDAVKVTEASSEVVVAATEEDLKAVVFLRPQLPEKLEATSTARRLVGRPERTSLKNQTAEQRCMSGVHPQLPPSWFALSFLIPNFLPH